LIPLSFEDVLSKMRIHQAYHFLPEKAHSLKIEGKKELTTRAFTLLKNR